MTRSSIAEACLLSSAPARKDAKKTEAADPSLLFSCLHLYICIELRAIAPSTTSYLQSAKLRTSRLRTSSSLVL
eukprot:scaffold1130_cov195-Pinguiococcus_pyrenoidosus.AAC.96